LRDLLFVIDHFSILVLVWRIENSNHIYEVNSIKPEVNSNAPPIWFVIFKGKANQDEEDNVDAVRKHPILVCCVEFLPLCPMWPIAALII